MKITRKDVQEQMSSLKKQNLRIHDLCGIKAMHPDVRMRAAAIFLIRDASA